MYPTFCNSARWWEVQSRKWQWVHWLSSLQWAAMRGREGWGAGVGLLGGSRDHLYLGMVAPSQVLCQARRLAGWKRAKSCDLNCIWKNGSQISSAFFWVVPVIGVTGVQQFLQRSKYVTDNPYKLTVWWLRTHFYRMIRCQMDAEGIPI